MSVPAMLSSPNLNLPGACFDLDDLQAMIEDYEGRIAEERSRREKAETQLSGCLSQIETLEQELARVKSLVVGALVKVQGSAPAPTPVAPPPTQAATVPAAPQVAAPPPTSWAARVPPAPMPKGARPATTTKMPAVSVPATPAPAMKAAPVAAPTPVAAAPKPAPAPVAPTPTGVAAPKPVVVAGNVPFAPPHASVAPATPKPASTTAPRTPEPAADHGNKPKRRIMRSRRG